MAGLRILLTGATGCIGRRILDGLKDDHQITCIARKPQLSYGIPIHDSITWLLADITDKDSLAAAFDTVRRNGGIDVVIHLAAHYDFTGEDHQRYWRTNVDGLRNVLDQCTGLALQRFVFASSVAACGFPRAGTALTETSPADGEHIYAVTKRIGEEMLAEYDDTIPSCIVRFAALFSDWCEYPPLCALLETWLSNAWNASILGGRGRSAIPYLHVEELMPFFRSLLKQRLSLGQREVLIASANSSASHIELFNLARRNDDNHCSRPLLIPRPLCLLGVWLRDLIGRVSCKRPFERPWMVKYIDQALTVDASRTHKRLSWQPREHLQLPHRLPRMIENMRCQAYKWQRRNHPQSIHSQPIPQCSSTSGRRPLTGPIPVYERA
jgi:nucleoside-diphosphate-sugar epimerase